MDVVERSKVIDKLSSNNSSSYDKVLFSAGVSNSILLVGCSLKLIVVAGRIVKKRGHIRLKTAIIYLILQQKGENPLLI